MARGFLAGILAGTVVSGVALGTASVVTGVPPAPSPEAAPLDVPAGSGFNGAREDVQASLPQVDGVIQSGDAPQVAAPDPDDLTQIDTADTQPTARPETGLAEGTLSAPQVDEDSALPGGRAVDEPSQPEPETTPQLSETDAPANDAGLSISADPAQPALPDVDSDSAAFPEPEQVTPAPEQQAGIATDDTDSDAEAETLPEDAPEEMSEPAQPSGTIGNMAGNVATGRLPSVGVDDAAPEATAEQVIPDDSESPAIRKYAEPFENPDEKPVMAIVLIDDGSSPIGLDALDSFPYPISFAVDAAWPGAHAAMQTYRDAGFEVLAMADLPAGAQPVDTETAMQTIISAVPEAVAIMEGTGTGLQTSRAASEQLIPILKETGHGLVLFSKGLDTAQKLIAREGVPTAAIFRDFDAKGQSEKVIRRFLDQAAFKAGREEGAVIMVGRLRADTITALLLWGLQDRANSVALAPVSAALIGGAEQ